MRNVEKHCIQCKALIRPASALKIIKMCAISICFLELIRLYICNGKGILCFGALEKFLIQGNIVDYLKTLKCSIVEPYSHSSTRNSCGYQREHRRGMRWCSYRKGPFRGQILYICIE